MKNKCLAILVVILIGLVLHVGSIEASGGPTVIVYATGDDAAVCERPDLPGVTVTQDVCNVQAAVNASPGGKVLLKGTFYFADYGADGYVVPGTDGTVFVTNDVEIMGDMDYGTTIKGGYHSFSVGYSPIAWAWDWYSDEVFSAPENAVPVNVTIKDITFENSLYSATRFWAATGGTFKDNRILDGRPLFFEPGVPENNGLSMGIMVMPPGMFFADQFDLISGEIEIKSNFMDGMFRRGNPADPWAVFKGGEWLAGLLDWGIVLVNYGAQITVKDNLITNTGVNGIAAGGNIGRTVIKSNVVHMDCQEFDTHPWYCTGIEAATSFWVDDYWLARETAEFEVRDNIVTIAGDSAELMGIFVDWNSTGPIVTGNQIAISSTTGTALRVTEVSDARVTDNVISGVAKYGVLLGTDPIWGYTVIEQDSNVVIGNVLDNFVGGEYDYYLGSGVTNNLVRIRAGDTFLDDSGNTTNTIVIEN